MTNGPRLRNIRIVFRREYRQQVRTRSFLASTFLMPVFLFAIITLSRVSISAGHMSTKAFIGTAGTVLVLLMFMALLAWSVVVMRAVLEEKSSRVIEVLLCSTTPEELMAGKILGIGAAGVTQAGVWLAIAIVIVSHNWSVVAMMLWVLVYYVLGFALYSSMFAALGAAFDSTDGAQQWTLLILSPLIVAELLITPMVHHPRSAGMVVASMVPPWAPMLMPAALFVSKPPAWQVAGSIILMVATIWVTIRLCARIYRVGILTYGKRPTAREMLRWMLAG